MTSFVVRSFRPGDRADVRRIACDTANGGAPLAGFPDREFIADLLTRYYTDFEPTSCWIVADPADRAVGYLSGCLDTRRYLSVVSRRVTPAAMLRAARSGLIFQGAFWRFLLAGLMTGLRSGSYHHRWLRTHPAHLHINLLPGARSGGMGRALMERFVRQAADAGAAGVHLGTRGDNQNAHRFFERMGFTVLERPVIFDPFTLRRGEMIAYGRALK